MSGCWNIPFNNKYLITDLRIWWKLKRFSRKSSFCDFKSVTEPSWILTNRTTPGSLRKQNHHPCLISRLILSCFSWRVTPKIYGLFLNQSWLDPCQCVSISKITLIDNWQFILSRLRISFCISTHYWIAKDLLSHKAPILSNLMLKWSPYFTDQFKIRTLRCTSKLQLLEPKYYTVVHDIYDQNG